MDGLSVIIPTLNEADGIAETLRQVLRAEPLEVIVVDGGSTDATVEIARREGAVVLQGAPGRGSQQSIGARHAHGDVLLFLHADTRLPDNYPRDIQQTLSQPGVAAGAFRFKLDETSWALRRLEDLVALRCRFFQLPYGDQGIFLRRETLEQAGGFPELPLMEDYELIQRLRLLGLIAIADADAVTSARRWKKLGVVRATLSNVVSVISYRLGTGAQTIAARRRT